MKDVLNQILNVEDEAKAIVEQAKDCLLYTSDAADE